MTETTTQELSPKAKDGLRKAADILGGSFTFGDTPSGHDYWYNACMKLYELSGAVPGNTSPFNPLRKSTPGKLGKGEAIKESSGYSKKIGSWKEFDAAANSLAGMNWETASSGDAYWRDVYRRIMSFANLAEERSKNDLAGGATKEQKEEAKKANQPEFKFDPVTLCSCGHAYHAHSRKHGCKFRGKDECFKFGFALVAVKPPATSRSKPEDFLEL